MSLGSDRGETVIENLVKLESLKGIVSTDEFVLLAKYRARRRYVLGFRSTKIDGLGVGVTEGYFVMLKVSLAFSAVEMLAKVISRKGQLGIHNESVVRAINSGKFDKMLDSIERDNVRRFGPASTPQSFKGGPIPLNSDLTAFVYMLRNFHFHGSFTPTETGLASSSRLRTLMLDLAISTLDAGEVALQKWVRKKSRRTN